MESWIVKQAEYSIAQFDKAIEIYYPAAVKTFRDPVEFYRGLTSQWNYLDAVEMVNWNEWINDGATVLDLGGGAGWLSAYISKIKSIRKIFILDSSKFFLTEMMPEIVRLMHGDAQKIVPIEGLFSPLFFEDETLDVVVICSSLHHADNLETVLKEINRVLKKGGLLFILNETPLSNFEYFKWSTKIFLSIIKTTFLKDYKRFTPNISSSGILYDPYLNDKIYTFWYWEKSIEKSGFRIKKKVKTKLLTRKSDKRGQELVHYICRK